MTETKDEQMQQKYFEMQMLAQQANQLKKQMQLIDNQMQEISSAMEGIDSLNESKESEILVPIHSGVFIKAEIKEKGKCIVSVGSDIAVPKTFDETKNILENNILEIGKYKDQMMEILEKCSLRQEEIEQEIVSLQNEQDV